MARAYLTSVGVSTYLPLIHEWPKPAVGSPIRPMFPGYLFVRACLAEHSGLIARAPGSNGFVGFGNGPLPLADYVIELLRSREGPDGVIRWDVCPTTPREVRIIGGPFRGMTAVLERRMPARGRVLVLLDILQRLARVDLPDRLITLR